MSHVCALQILSIRLANASFAMASDPSYLQEMADLEDVLWQTTKDFTAARQEFYAVLVGGLSIDDKLLELEGLYNRAEFGNVMLASGHQIMLDKMQRSTRALTQPSEVWLLNPGVLNSMHRHS